MKEYIVTEHHDFPYEEPKPQELIRCKDCKRNPKESLVGCPLADIWDITDDDYCSRAERKGK